MTSSSEFNGTEDNKVPTKYHAYCVNFTKKEADNLGSSKTCSKIYHHHDHDHMFCSTLDKYSDATFLGDATHTRREMHIASLATDVKCKGVQMFVGQFGTEHPEQIASPNSSFAPTKYEAYCGTKSVADHLKSIGTCSKIYNSPNDRMFCSTLGTTPPATFLGYATHTLEKNIGEMRIDSLAEDVKCKGVHMFVGHGKEPPERKAKVQHNERLESV